VSSISLTEDISLVQAIGGNDCLSMVSLLSAGIGSGSLPLGEDLLTGDPKVRLRGELHDVSASLVCRRMDSLRHMRKSLTSPCRPIFSARGDTRPDGVRVAV
jgi:hypothetical protein